jgi:hypothetical protein
MEQSPGGANRAQIIKKFLAFTGTQRFILVFTKLANDPYPEADESNPPPSNVFP